MRARCAATPVETVLSGPAAGVVGAELHRRRPPAIANLIGIDIGGTSADISLIHDGEPGMTTTGRIGDWPVGLPMIDIDDDRRRRRLDRARVGRRAR